MDKIECTGRDGEARFFYVEVVDTVFGIPWDPNGDRRATAYHVWRSDPPCRTDDYFEAVFVEVNQNTLQNTMMDARGHVYFRQKGIVETIIEYAGETLGKTIESSTNVEAKKRFGHHEYQIPAVDAAWKRLQAKYPDRVRFDAKNGRFIYTPKAMT